MKRRIFFWLEKLRITPAERKTVTGLMVVLSLLAVSNLVFSPPEPFAGRQYAELKKQFDERTARLKAKEEERMRRYYPPERERAAVAASADTVSPDSAGKKKPEPPPKGEKSLQNELINVNEAGRELLITLPGIGPAYSERIIKYREEHGTFKTVEELKNIKGIGEKRLEKLKPLIKL